MDQGNTEEGTERRFNQTLRNLLNTPHKPHKAALAKKHKPEAKRPSRKGPPKSEGKPIG